MKITRDKVNLIRDWLMIVFLFVNAFILLQRMMPPIHVNITLPNTIRIEHYNDYCADDQVDGGANDNDSGN